TPEERTDVSRVDVHGGDDRRAEEASAYAFARELLMPREDFLEHLRDLDLEIAVAKGVARFGVSPEVVTIRSCELGVVSAAEKDQFIARLNTDPGFRVRFRA